VRKTRRENKNNTRRQTVVFSSRQAKGVLLPKEEEGKMQRIEMSEQHRLKETTRGRRRKERAGAALPQPR
jgi:hypothetical protein